MQQHVYRRQFRRYGRQRDRFPGAGVLILLGLLVWALSSFAFFWALLLLAAGAAFTVRAVNGDRRWMLLAGGVLLGAGVGQLVALPLGWVSGALADAATTAGLGFGFWFVYLLETRRFHSTHFGWAPVVGTILVAIATVQVLLGLPALSRHVFQLVLHDVAPVIHPRFVPAAFPWHAMHAFLGWWPLLVIAAGFWLIWVGYRARRSH